RPPPRPPLFPYTTLFRSYSPELVSTQNEYLLALKTRDQLQQSQIADARDRADALVSAARQRLAQWDLPAEDIAALERTREPRPEDRKSTRLNSSHVAISY